MTDLQLHLRQISEMRGVVAGKRVAAHIRRPAGEAGGAAQLPPVLLPVAGHAAILRAHAGERA